MPELDADAHSCGALQQAVLLTTNLPVRFAALVGRLSADASDALCERLRVPNEFSELGRLVCLHHARCHSANSHRAEDLFLTLELCDALRRPERFELFLRACEADARGRLGLNHGPYSQADKLRSALNAARDVDVKALVQRFPAPQDLGPAIRAARIAAITALPPP
jgi:tRNA nucleotidyltransferase (CCA-adding enzyme)